jgi:cell division protein FtsB
METTAQNLLVMHLGNSILKQISDEAEKQQLREEIEKLKALTTKE